MKKRINVLMTLTLLLISYNTIKAQPPNSAYLNNLSQTCDIEVEIEWIGLGCSGTTTITSDNIPPNTFFFPLAMPSCPDCIPINFRFISTSTGQASPLYEIYDGYCTLDQGHTAYSPTSFNQQCIGSSNFNPPNQMGWSYNPVPMNNLIIYYRP